MILGRLLHGRTETIALAFSLATLIICSVSATSSLVVNVITTPSCCSVSTLSNSMSIIVVSTVKPPLEYNYMTFIRLCDGCFVVCFGVNSIIMSSIPLSNVITNTGLLTNITSAIRVPNLCIFISSFGI